MAQNFSQDKQVGSIFRTIFYEKYKFNTYQRDIKEAHVKELMERMKEHGFLPNKAISVNEKFEIIDGHHRYLAAKNLGIPMLVQVCKGMKEEDIVEANQAQNDWGKDGFTNYWAKRGNVNYVALRDFMVKYPKIKMTQALMLLANEPNSHPTSKTFKAGKFQVKSVKKAEEFAVKVETCAKYFGKAYGSKFVSALLVAETRCHNWIFSEFIDKLAKFPDKLTPSITTKGYLERFEDIYNYHRVKKQHIKLIGLYKD